jgi:hypothetical protein
MSDSQTFDTEELIAHAPDAIIFADSAGVIRMWNRASHRARTLSRRPLGWVLPCRHAGSLCQRENDRLPRSPRVSQALQKVAPRRDRILQRADQVIE